MERVPAPDGYWTVQSHKHNGEWKGAKNLDAYNKDTEEASSISSIDEGVATGSITMQIMVAEDMTQEVMVDVVAINSQGRQ